MNEILRKIKRNVFIYGLVIFVLTGCGNYKLHNNEIETIESTQETVYEEIVIKETNIQETVYEEVQETETKTDVLSEGYEEKIYDSNFLFYEDIEFPEQVELMYETINKDEEGILYLIRIDMNEEFSGRDYYGHDRTKLGYFYVTDAIVYFVDELDVDSEMTIEKIKSEGRIIYAEQDYYESLEITESENDYLEFVDNNCIYHYFNNSVETGYYRTVGWNKEQGLIMFRNGFGALSESISLYRQGVDIEKYE